MTSSCVALAAIAAFGCASQAPQAGPGDADASGTLDAGPPVTDAAPHDASSPCFTCADAAALDIDASLGRRVQLQLQSCAGIEGCHGASAAIQLQFPIGAELSQIVGVPSIERSDLLRVKPFDPLQSYLYLKVLGDGGIDGGRMPLGSAFNPKTPKLFFDWIEAGAPDAE